MRLESYKGQVNGSTGPGGGLQHSGNMDAYGAGISAGLGALQKGIGDLYQVRLKEIDDEMKLQQMNAETDYNKRIADLLYNDETGLAYTSLKDAANSAERYREEEAKIREDIAKQLHYKQSQKGFIQHAEQSWITNNTKMEGHEKEQGEKYKDLSLANYIESATNIGELNYDNGDLLRTQINGIYQKIEDMYGYEGEEALRARKNKALEGIMQGVLSVAGTNKNNEAIDTITGIAKEYGMMPDRYVKFENAAMEFKQASVLGDTQTIDDALAANGNDVEKTTESLVEKLKQKGYGNTTWEQFRDAIRQNESGGNEDAVNSESGAYGAFQIMPSSWAEWSVEAGVGGRPMTDREAYRKVVEYKLKDYFDKYGPEGAAVAWFAGEGNAQRWVNGEPDAIGDNNSHYSWDLEENGGGTSVRNYVNNMMRVVRQGKHLTDGQLAELREKTRKTVEQRLAEKERERQKALREQSLAITNTLYQMEQNGATAGDLAGYLHNAIAGNPELIAKFGGQVSALQQTQKRMDLKGLEANDANMNAVTKDILSGATQEEVMQKIENSGLLYTPKQINDIYKLMEDRENHTGIFNPHINELKAPLKDALGYSTEDFNDIWPGMAAEVSAYSLRFYNEHGRQPSQAEKLAYMKEAGTKQTYSFDRPFTYDTDIQLSRSQIRQYGGDDAILIQGDDGERYVRITNRGTQIKDVPFSEFVR